MTYINFVGNLLIDTYIIIKKLGDGAYATVWLAYNIIHKQLVAVKIFEHKDTKHGLYELKLFDTFKNLKFKSFIKCLANFIYDDYYCLVLELMDNSLYNFNYKKLTTDNIIFILKQILEYLVELHKNNYIYCDLKPENILTFGLNYSDILKKILECHNKLLNNKQNKKKNNNKIVITELCKFINENIIDLNDSDESINSSEKSSDKYDNINNSDYDNSLITSDNSDSQSEKSYDSNISIDTNNYKNTIIKFGDIGSCKICNDTDNNTEKCVQTRYFICPEIILHLNYNHKCDIWSLGCLLYELITDSILYNPSNENINQEHLMLIIQSVGVIPKYMIDKSPIKDIYFTHDYKLKYKDVIIYDSIIKKLLNHRTRDTKYIYLIDLLMKMLIIDPNKRISSDNALKHPLFTKLIPT